jgi:hypothetical protein
VARFLSPAWVADLATAAERLEVEADDPVVVHQVVTGGPDGERGYRLRLAGGRVAVEADGGGDPDVTLTTDWPTAVALARGELAVTDAFMAGRLRVAGDLRALLRAGGALAGVDAVLAEVRDRTTWD